ncbi:MAG: type II secretion system protein [Xanthomonadales bacterium]|nr:type II secretion system protein [Xanthomonadales bacterium]
MMRLPPARRAAHGFTLIEAIAAFVLLAIFLGVLMSALSISMRQTVRAEQESLAAQWAQSKLDLVGIGEKLEEGSSRDRFDKDFRWEMLVEEYVPERDEPVDTESIGMRLYRVDLDVFWGRPPRERSTRFTTLRAYAPDQAVLFDTPPGETAGEGGALPTQRSSRGGRGAGNRDPGGSMAEEKR